MKKIVRKMKQYGKKWRICVIIIGVLLFSIALLGTNLSKTLKKESKHRSTSNISEPIAYFKFDGNLDNSGTSDTIKASIDNEQNLFTDDSHIGKAAHFSNNSIQLSGIDNDTFSNGTTISFWSKGSSGFAYYYGDDNYYTGVNYANNNIVGKYKKNKDNDINYENIDNEWHFIVMTYNTENSQNVKVTMYLDGELVETKSDLISIFEDDSFTFYLGSNHQDDFFDGTIDEFKIFDTCFTDEEVEVLMDYVQDPVAYFKFNNNLNNDGINQNITAEWNNSESAKYASSITEENEQAADFSNNNYITIKGLENVDFSAGATITFFSKETSGWSYYWGNNNNTHYTGINHANNDIVVKYRKNQDNDIPANVNSLNDWHLITITYTSIQKENTNKTLTMEVFIDSKKIRSIDQLGNFFNEDLSFYIGNNGNNSNSDGLIDEFRIYNRVLSDDEILLASDEYFPLPAVVWFDGTVGDNSLSSPYSGAIDRIASEDEFQIKDGETYLTLPTSAGDPTNKFNYTYKLYGWYDIYSGEYYKPGASVPISKLGTEETNHNTVFYANWWADDYNFGNKTTADGKQALDDDLFSYANSFIETYVFDYNELFNIQSANLDNVKLNRAGHKEQWTDSQINIAFAQYSRTDGSLGDILNRNHNNNNQSRGRSDDHTFAGVITSNLYNTIRPIYTSNTNKVGINYVGIGESLYQHNSGTGYYYFDSRVNSASYSKRNNRFYVYDKTEKTYETALGSDFLPFNDGKTSYDNGEVNYWFGFHSTIKFHILDNVGDSENSNLDENGNHTTFTFYGDDDVFVLIDGKLVLDMGGIHDTVFGKIDLTNGDVYLGDNGAQMTNPDYYTQGVPPEIVESDRKKVEEASEYVKSLKGGNHTLQIFYLERGTGGANNATYFNLQPSLEHEIYKVDEDGNGIANVTFELYAAETNENYKVDNNQHEAKEFKVASDEDDPLITITTEDNLDRSLPQEMQRKGYSYFTDADGNNIDFISRANDGKEYYILRETQTPAEYRGLLKDIILKYNKQLNTLEVVNQFEVGSYSSFNILIYDVQKELYYAKLNSNGTVSKLDGENNTISLEEQKDALLFAVPLIKINDNWYPVYGSNTQGFTVVNIYSKDDYIASGGQSNDEDVINDWVLKHNLMATVLRQTASKIAPDWVFEFDEKRNRFSAVLNNLPGDPSRYILNNKDDYSKADLSLIGFYVDKESLIRLVSGISEDNIEGMDDAEKYEAIKEMLNSWSNGSWATLFDERIEEDPTGKSDSWNTLKTIINNAYITGDDTQNITPGYSLVDISRFYRSYASVIYAPNEIREIKIIRRNEKGVGLENSEFSVYKTFNDAVNNKNKITSGITGTVDNQKGMLVLGPQNPNPGNTNGYKYINWEAELKNDDDGFFWIRETKAPDGETINDSIIQVYVGKQTIYANASGYKADKDGNPVIIDDYSKEDSTTKSGLEAIQSNSKYSTDGILVRNSIGKLFQSMSKYADMVVDTSLVDITARDYILIDGIETGKTNPEQNKKWTFAGNDGEADNHNYNLHYWGSKLNSSSNYGINHQKAIYNEKIYASTNNGFIYLRPTQTPYKNETSTNPFSYDENHKNNNYETRRTILREEDGTPTDLSDIFSPETIIVVDSNDDNSLMVTKKVTGDGDKDHDCHFTVTLSNKLNGTYGDMKFEDGVAHFTLKDGGSKTATYLPNDTSYEVVEEEANKDGYTTTINNAKGTVKNKDDIKVEVVNYKPYDNRLTVTKKVTGDGDKDYDFHFIVTLNNQLNGTYGDMKFEDGVAHFTLKDGETKTATYLPNDISYEVAEEEANKDGYTTTINNENGTINNNGNIIVEVVNYKPYDNSLTITKKVTGDGDKNFDFHFTVTLSNKLNVTYGDMKFEDGVAHFTLKDGESKTVTNIPNDISYEVVEKEANMNEYKTTYKDNEGIIEGDISVLVVNERHIVIPNTLDDIIKYIGVFVLGFAALLGMLFIYLKKFKKNTN